MPYQGNTPIESYTPTVKDSFSGNGSTTAFTLSQPTVTNDVRVVVENVVQDPTVAYTVLGTTLTFTSAPVSGTNNIYVVHLGPAVATTQPPSDIANATTFASNLSVQGLFNSVGIDDNADATAITIDSSEVVLVGKTSNTFSQQGVALRANNDSQITRDAGIALSLNRTTNYGDILGLYKDGTTVGSIGAASGNTYIGSGDTGIAFSAADDTVYPITTATGGIRDAAIDLGGSTYRYKDAYLSGGVYLGGTGSANKLDDYEFGTWTPTLPNGGSVVVNGAFYTKVGQQVHIQAQCSFTPTNNGSIFRIGGIPFVSKAGASTYSAGSLGYSAALNTSDWSDPLVEQNNGTYLYFHAMNGGAAILNSAFSGVAYNLIFSATYITNA